MSSIHEIATVTAKGQITLPKSIRQALGVGYGGKVAFDLQGSQVVVSRAEDPLHEDPAIVGFLHLLEADLELGRHITNLPEDLIKAMVAALSRSADLNEDIQGDVEL